MNKHVNLIRKIAWSFHRSTGLEWDDLFQEAAVAYYESLESYDESRGKITTHAWNCISNRLKNYLKEQEEYKARKSEEELFSIEDVEMTRHPAEMASDFWESLTEDAKVVANMIIFTPRKYLYSTSQEVENRITRIMQRKRWSKQKIELAILSLKAACQ